MAGLGSEFWVLLTQESLSLRDAPGLSCCLQAMGSVLSPCPETIPLCLDSHPAFYLALIARLEGRWEPS